MEVLSTPLGDCDTQTPLMSQYWCGDVLNVRRGLVRGVKPQPIFQEPSGATNPPDVDSVPLPPFVSIAARTGGALQYNGPGLQNCPAKAQATAAELSWVEHEEQVQSGEAAAPITPIEAMGCANPPSFDCSNSTLVCANGDWTCQSNSGDQL